MANGHAAMAAMLALLAATALYCGMAAAVLLWVEHSARNDGMLSLLVVGDWGRGGTHNQSRVAEQVKGIFICLFVHSFIPLLGVVPVIFGSSNERKKKDCSYQLPKVSVKTRPKKVSVKTFKVVAAHQSTPV